MTTSKQRVISELSAAVSSWRSMARLRGTNAGAGKKWGDANSGKPITLHHRSSAMVREASLRRRRAQSVATRNPCFGR